MRTLRMLLKLTLLTTHFLKFFGKEESIAMRFDTLRAEGSDSI